MNISFTCPFCGETFDYDIDEKVIKSAPSRGVEWMKAPAYVRELFITGICYKCQSETFGTSTPGYDLGPEVGECDICGAPLHESDLEKGVCPHCHGNINESEEPPYA